MILKYSVLAMNWLLLAVGLLVLAVVGESLAFYGVLWPGLNLFFIARRGRIWSETPGLDVDVQKGLFYFCLGLNAAVILLVIYKMLGLLILTKPLFFLGVYLCAHASLSIKYLVRVRPPDPPTVPIDNDPLIQMDRRVSTGPERDIFAGESAWVRKHFSNIRAPVRIGRNARKVLKIVFFPAFLLAAYAFVSTYGGMYVPSHSWFGIGNKICIALSFAFIAWLAYAYKTGEIVPREGEKKPGLLSYAVLGALYWLLLWPGVVLGFGKLATVSMGTPKNQLYTYGRSNPYSFVLMNTGVTTIGGLRVGLETYNTWPPGRPIKVREVNSWFGNFVTGYYFMGHLKKVESPFALGNERAGF